MTDPNEEWPVGLGAVLYGDRSDGRRHSDHGTRDLWHVVDRVASVDGYARFYRLQDGTHTYELWYHAEDLLADFAPAGWTWPTGSKPLYHLTRTCGAQDAGDLMTDSGSSSAPTDLRFAEEYVRPILEGEKTATARIGEKYDSLTPGDRMRLIDPEDRELATGRLFEVGRGPATAMLTHVNRADGHASYASAAAFLSAMRRHYPDQPATPKTTVYLLGFRSLTVNEAYRDELRVADGPTRGPPEGER